MTNRATTKAKTISAQRTPTVLEEALSADPLDRKWRRTRDYQFLVCDPTDAARRVEETTAALRTALAMAKGEETGPEVAQAQADRDRAKDELAACYDRITFQSVSSRAFRQLMDEHPPTDEQRRKDAEWNPDTFQPALIAACARDIHLTPEQWTERLEDGNWSTGDRNAIFGAALAPNLAS